MADWNMERFKGVSQKMYDNASQFHFYLGLDKPDYNLHHYKWVKNIINNKTGEDIKLVSKTTYKKKKIPKVKRRKVWTQQHGSNVMMENVIVVIKLLLKNFECGHIMLKKMVGLDLDNLVRPM